MGKRVYKKLEATHIQGVCVACGKRKQAKGSKLKYRPICQYCHDLRIGKKSYRIFKKDVCEDCGFIPVHMCQLDVDHIDGNHNNNEQSNLKTLCANCHRLKSFINDDYKNGTI